MPPSTTIAETDVVTDADATRVRSAASARHLIGAGLLLTLALIIYRPWEQRPFDITDFSEFLPHLLGHDSAAERFAAFVRYYFLEQGRANFLGYAALVGKWAIFGDDSVAWQLSRFALMAGVVGGSYALLRRLGANALHAALASALFIVASSAATAWIGVRGVPRGARVSRYERGPGGA